MLTWPPPKSIIPFCFSLFSSSFLPLWNQSFSPLGRYLFSPCFDPKFSHFGIKSPKKAWQTKIAQIEKLVA
jgi:hypothetical protein